MEQSMEQDDSLLSLPGPARLHNAYSTPPTGISLQPNLIASNLPTDDSFDYSRAEGSARVSGASSPYAEGASFPEVDDVEDEEEAEEEEEEEEEADEEGDEEEDEEEEEEYDGSETSSAMFDQEADPEGWARRLDELAGMLEMGEKEARAMRWGPELVKGRHGPDLPLDQFRKLIDHHLAATEWKYNSPAGLFPSIIGRPTSSGPLGSDTFETDQRVHPIRVVGRNWASEEAIPVEPIGLGIGGVSATVGPSEDSPMRI